MVMPLSRVPKQTFKISVTVILNRASQQQCTCLFHLLPLLKKSIPQVLILLQVQAFAIFTYLY